MPNEVRKGVTRGRPTRRSSTASSLMSPRCHDAESTIDRSLWSGIAMDFELSDEQEAFRKVVRDFAEAEIAPHAEEWDRDPHLPRRHRARDGRPRPVRSAFPREYGGSGADFTTFCIAIEELGRVDQSMGITLEAGRRPRRQPDLPVRHRGAAPGVAARPVRGTALGAFGLTEPDAGSDAGGTRTTATLDGDGVGHRR